MTNHIKKSLEDNKEYILSKLPEEFHSNFIDSIDTVEPIKPISKKEVLRQAREALIKVYYNPDSVDNLLPLIAKDPQVHNPE